MSSRREPYWLIALAAAAAWALILVGESMHPTETIESLQRAIQGHPNDAGLHVRLGNAYLRETRPTDAKTEFETAMRLDPQNAEAPYRLATLHVEQGDSVGAQKLLEQNVKLHPDDAPSNELLGELVVKSLGEEFAMPVVRKYFEAALKADPARPVAAAAIAKVRLAEGDAEGAAKLLEAPLISYPRSAPLHLQMAAVLWKQKKYALASQHFNTATVFEPANVAAFCDWGAMLVEAGSSHAAEQVLRRAVELNERSALAHMKLGCALRDEAMQGEADMAVAQTEFERSLELDDKPAVTYFEIAKMWLAMKRDASALAFLKQAIRRDPMMVDAYVLLARQRFSSEDPTVHDEEEGLIALNDAILATKGRDIGLVASFARELARRKQYDKAIAQLDAAMQQPGLTEDLKEALGARRQQYQIATVPNNEGNPDIVNPDALVKPDALEYPAWDKLKPGAAPAKIAPIDIFLPPLPDAATKPGSNP